MPLHELFSALGALSHGPSINYVTRNILRTGREWPLVSVTPLPKDVTFGLDQGAERSSLKCYA